MALAQCLQGALSHNFPLSLIRNTKSVADRKRLRTVRSFYIFHTFHIPVEDIHFRMEGARGPVIKRGMAGSEVIKATFQNMPPLPNENRAVLLICGPCDILTTHIKTLCDTLTHTD
jgi:hypothetical protein